MGVIIKKKGEKVFIEPSKITASEFDMSSLQTFTKSSSERVSFLPDEVAAAIDDELTRQFDKWGPQEHDPYKWMTIIQEELGEVAQAILEDDLDKERDLWYLVREEVIQTIACLVQLYQREK